MNGINLSKVEETVQAIQKDPQLKLRKWYASAKWLDGVKNEVRIREFVPFITDEPEPLGGTDKGSNPVENLIAAALSCFIITFEVLATQARITLKQVEAEIEADLNVAVFLGLEEGNGGIINPKIKLNAVTSGSEEEVQQIAETALGKSPVLTSLKASVQLV